jgi:hypothetical protein
VCCQVLVKMTTSFLIEQMARREMEQVSRSVFSQVDTSRITGEYSTVGRRYKDGCPTNLKLGKLLLS